MKRDVLIVFDGSKDARTAFGQVLQTAGLADSCVMTAPQEVAVEAKKDRCIIWIGPKDPPDTWSVLDNDRFKVPVRAGDVLARLYKYGRAGAQKDAAAVLDIGGGRLDMALGAFTAADGQNIKLTEKEIHILQVLADKKGAVMARGDLLHEIWGYGENIETHTLETHIYRLRQKIETDPAKPQIIVSADLGYKIGI